MKATLIVEGREFPIEIHDPELHKLLKPLEKTGYERVEDNQFYYNVYVDDEIDDNKEEDLSADDDMYNIANYYSDRAVAENNARADRLMRQLRRFAVEHRESKPDWKDSYTRKYYLKYNHDIQDIVADFCHYLQFFGAIYFEDEDMANLAIETFHDELIWYFTEYKDSL